MEVNCIAFDLTAAAAFPIWVECCCSSSRLHKLTLPCCDLPFNPPPAAHYHY